MTGDFVTFCGTNCQLFRQPTVVLLASPAAAEWLATTEDLYRRWHVFRATLHRNVNEPTLLSSPSTSTLTLTLPWPASAIGSLTLS